MSAVEAVEAEVRELVRRRGLDPIADRTAMRRLVDEVVTHYDERALTSSLTPLPDRLQAARSVYDAVAGFGPLQRHLDDPSVEEIWINERLSGGLSRDARPDSRRPSRRHVQDQPEQLPDLRECGRSDVASHLPEPTGGDRPYVLALGSGRPVQTVVLISSNVDFGPESAQRRRERDDVDD